MTDIQNHLTDWQVGDRLLYAQDNWLEVSKTAYLKAISDNDDIIVETYDDNLNTVIDEQKRYNFINIDAMSREKDTEIAHLQENAKKIAKWLCEGNTGTSSLTMLACSLGEKYKDQSPPSDPSDFNRCLELLKFCPFVKDSFKEISKISTKWEALINNWGEIEKCFINEVGSNWEQRNKSATKTYELIKELTGK